MDIKVNAQSSIRIASNKIIYFDPFKIEEEAHDADIIFITHDHFDHFSIEDIKKIEKEDTVYVIPDSMYNLLGGENVVTLYPNEKTTIEGYDVLTIPSYNASSNFHPKEKGYLAYLINIDNNLVYVAGDCDANEDNLKVKCDIAIVPIGGKYTMDYQKAAEYINKIKPQTVIPTHYGDIVGNKNDGILFKDLIEKDIKVSLLLNY